MDNLFTVENEIENTIIRNINLSMSQFVSKSTE